MVGKEIKNNGLLLIARKFNDIFYIVSSEAWKRYEKHYLIVIANNGELSDYPLLEMFDRADFVKSKRGRTSILPMLLKLRSITRKMDYNAVASSNVALTTNLYLSKPNKVDTVYLLEDGLMNYYQFVETSDRRKKLVLALFNINEEKIHNKIKETYLLCPEEAVYYYGTPKKITIDFDTILKQSKLPVNLEGKRILVGNDLYRYYDISVEEYSKLTNDIIKKYDIDYYIPHFLAWPNEDIDCEAINISETRATLEVYASKYNFTIYSIFSSVLFTTKLINPKMHCVLLDYPRFCNVSKDNIIYKKVDEVIEIK